MELETALLTRRSVRSFTGEPIPENMLDEVLLAGILAPSSRNFQSSQFIVVREPAKLAALAKAKAGGSMIVKAGCAVVVIGDSARSDAWIEDCSISMTQMMLRAADLGLGSCWIHCKNRASTVEGVASPDYVAELLKIPVGFSVLAILALGNPADTPKPHEKDEANRSRIHREIF